MNAAYTELGDCKDRGYESQTAIRPLIPLLVAKKDLEQWCDLSLFLKTPKEKNNEVACGYLQAGPLTLKCICLLHKSAS